MTATKQRKKVKKSKQISITQVIEADREIRDYLEGCFQAEGRGILSQSQINHRNLCRWMLNRLDVMADLGLTKACDYPPNQRLLLDLQTFQLEDDEGNPLKIKLFPYSLEKIGVYTPAQGNRFIDFYLKVYNPRRSWVSGCQVNQKRVAAIALTPNYNRLPQWVREGLVRAPESAQIGGDRIGDVWRLIPCVKAWKWAPLPKKLAEKVGKMSPRMRMLSAIAWRTKKTYDENHWFSRSEVESSFWSSLARMSQWLLIDQCDWALKFGTDWGCHEWAAFLTQSLGLPWGAIEFSGEVTLEAIEEMIIQYASPAMACETLFGVGGKATIKAFIASDKNRWQWAKALAAGNADAVQKILQLEDCIGFEPEAVDFLKSLPMNTRIRLLQSTTFKHRGEIHTITADHIRDTGYLWKQLATKPALGRIRCWFSTHEALAAEYVRNLPDEALPIPSGWERVDGLCAVDRTWELEFPKRVATLKYWGQCQRNCVGGYGPAIKSGRSVVFVVRERGTISHTVEVVGKEIRQFYKAGNQSGDGYIRGSVSRALQEAGLIY